VLHQRFVASRPSTYDLASRTIRQISGCKRENTTDIYKYNSSDIHWMFNFSLLPDINMNTDIK
jgi:hypothetical protein